MKIVIDYLVKDQGAKPEGCYRPKNTYVRIGYRPRPVHEKKSMHHMLFMVFRLTDWLWKNSSFCGAKGRLARWEAEALRDALYKSTTTTTTTTTTKY